MATADAANGGTGERTIVVTPAESTSVAAGVAVPSTALTWGQLGHGQMILPADDGSVQHSGHTGSGTNIVNQTAQLVRHQPAVGAAPLDPFATAPAVYWSVTVRGEPQGNPFCTVAPPPPTTHISGIVNAWGILQGAHRPSPGLTIGVLAGDRIPNGEPGDADHRFWGWGSYGEHIMGGKLDRDKAYQHAHEFVWREHPVPEEELLHFKLEPERIWLRVPRTGMQDSHELPKDFRGRWHVMATLLFPCSVELKELAPESWVTSALHSGSM